MLSESHLLTAPTAAITTALPDAQLLLAFGSGAPFQQLPLETLRRAWPKAHILGCSTAGNIHDVRVDDDMVSLTAVHFDKTAVTLVHTPIASAADSHAVGARLAAALTHDGLRHVFVLTDGLHLNGSDFLAGLREALPAAVTITGGMSGDGSNFTRTLVCANGMPAENMAAALGLYGEDLRIGYGSLGGWEPFGAQRSITRSIGNVLYELDGESALALYKRYLGEHAAELPASALRFPLALRPTEDSTQWLVRTVLSVDEAAQSMTFAGDLPEGCTVQLMKADFERLIDGASNAAANCVALGGSNPTLAILISCVGRRLVLRQRVEEEVESVRELLGERPVLTGFYSYGEFSPLGGSLRCELHNQTMTITTFDEA